MDSCSHRSPAEIREVVEYTRAELK